MLCIMFQQQCMIRGLQFQTETRLRVSKIRLITHPPSANQCRFTNSPLDGTCRQINIQQTSQLGRAMEVVFASCCNRQAVGLGLRVRDSIVLTWSDRADTMAVVRGRGSCISVLGHCLAYICEHRSSGLRAWCVPYIQSFRPCLANDRTPQTRSSQTKCCPRRSVFITPRMTF
jgi:hypothetical protein